MGLVAAGKKAVLKVTLGYGLWLVLVLGEKVESSVFHLDEYMFKV